MGLNNTSYLLFLKYSHINKIRQASSLSEQLSTLEVTNGATLFPASSIIGLTSGVLYVMLTLPAVEETVSTRVRNIILPDMSTSFTLIGALPIFTVNTAAAGVDTFNSLSAIITNCVLLTVFPINVGSFICEDERGTVEYFTTAPPEIFTSAIPIRTVPIDSKQKQYLD